MNSVRYGLPKNILRNIMDKQNTIPAIKPNILNNILKI